MGKTKRIIAALTAIIITATSTSLMSVCADENGGSDFGFASTTTKSDNIEAAESNAQLYEKLAQLLKQGDSLKYGEALYTTGTPDGEKWTKEFYEQRVEFYGEDLLSKYIVDGEFLRKSVESDMKGLLDKTENELDKYVDIINDYLMSNSIAGSAYAIKNDGVDKLLITYDGHIEKIKAYIAEIGIDESLVVFSQAHDMVVTKPATTIAVTRTKPVTTITMPVLDDPDIQTAVVTVTVMSVNGDDILVKPVDGSPELKSSNKFSLSAKKFPNDIKPKSGMKLEITYNGDILETYPAQFGNVQKIVAVKDDTVKDDATLLKGTKDMTLNDVMRLAEKGDELDWSDFKDYKGNDVGSGLHIWEFDVDRYNAKLRVGGSYLDAKPDYIKLIMKNGVEVDVRTEDLSRWFGYDGQSSKATVKGDANCDSDVNMSDAVIIMQSLANPAKYGVNGTDENHITEQGKINGDIAGNNDGITNADALAVQKKLLGLDKTDVQSIDSSLIANKVFVYEKSADPGIYDDLCDLSFGSNGTYSYNIGYYRSSNQDQGTWTISGDTLVLTGQYGTNKFRYDDKALVYIAESSDGFSDFNDKSTPKDGEKFILAEEPDYATINNLSEIVTIKSDYNPIMSDCSGIGILLEFDSKNYSISLRTDDGHFTTWDISKGNGPIENAGKTYKIGNSGYIFWTPDEINFDADYKNEIVIIGEKDGKSVKLGNIVVTPSNSHTLTAVLK